MSVKEITLDYEPRGPFKRFHSRAERFVVIVAHRRAGKTVATINDLVERALQTVKEDAQYGYVCPTFSQAKKVAWKYLKAAVAPIPGIKINESECSVVLPNRSQITLFGADNPDSLRGLYFDGIVLDEFGDMKGRVYSEVVRPAVSDRAGWVVFIGTPRGKNTFYEKREQARINKSGKWLYMEIKASTSGLLRAEEMADMREELDDDEWQAEMECSFDAAIKGSYYGKWIERIKDAGQITTVPHIKGLDVQTAWDLGRTDALAIWFFQVYGGQIRVINHYETSQMDIIEVLDDFEKEIVEPLNYSLGTAWLPHDAKAKTIGSKKSVIEQLLDRGLDCRIVEEHKVRDGINAVRHTLPLCYFDAEKCYEGVEHLKSYQREYDADRQVFANTPKHDIHSHTADAFRYLAMAIRDAEVIATGKQANKKQTPAEAYANWNEQRAINTVTPNTSWILDDLWDSRSSSAGYIRI